VGKLRKTAGALREEYCAVHADDDDEVEMEERAGGAASAGKAPIIVEDNDAEIDLTEEAPSRQVQRVSDENKKLVVKRYLAAKLKGSASMRGAATWSWKMTGVKVDHTTVGRWVAAFLVPQPKGKVGQPVACLGFDLRLRERVMLLRRVARIPVSMRMVLNLAKRLQFSGEFLYNPAAQRMQLSNDWSTGGCGTAASRRGVLRRTGSCRCRSRRTQLRPTSSASKRRRKAWATTPR